MQNLYIINEKNYKLTLPKDKNNIEVNNNLFDFKLNDGDIFVSYDHESPLEFRLEYYNIPYNSLVITTKNTELNTVIKEDNSMEDYAIFSGEKMEVMKTESKVSILKSFKLLVNVMYQMMEAGYLELKNYKKIDDWILSFEEPILKLFKVYFKFEEINPSNPIGIETIGTSNPSVCFEEEFYINPQFRQMILITIMKVVSNFIVNNNMVDLKDVNDWQDIKMWNKLKKKVKLLK